jgi:hypothetical protein
MCLYKIREFIWPLLEPENINKNTKKINSKKILIKEPDNLKVAFELVIKNYDAENERRKSVESKSIIFIGTISLITTILITISKDFFLKENIKYDANSILFIATVIIYIVYLTRTLWFSVKCLERRGYHTINYDLYNKSDDEYLKCVIAELSTIINKNHKVINEKVDFMVMAQEYFKRAIILLAAYPILHIVMSLLQKINVPHILCNFLNK